MGATDARDPIGYWELIRGNTNFRFLWFGQIVSLLGDWFNLIASASLVAALTRSGFAVGSLFIVRMLAHFLASPIAGVVADRYNRKHILIVTDIARAVTVCGFLLVREPGHVWLLYTLTAIQLALSGFFFPARTAILPDIVPPRGVGAANAITSATWSVMLALGAAIGGLVSGTWGVYPAFAIDALTFVLSALLLAQIKWDAKPGLAGTDGTLTTVLNQYLDGLRYLCRHADIGLVVLHKAAMALLFASAFEVVQVAISKEVFAIGVGGNLGLGLLFGTVGVGTGVGPIVARYFTKDRIRALGLTLILGYCLASLGMFVISFLSSFPTVLLGTLLRGFGSGIIWVFSTQLLLQLVPDHIRGRVFASEFALFTLLGSIGIALAGHALDAGFGIAGLVRWMAGLILVPAVLWTLWTLKGLSRQK